MEGLTLSSGIFYFLAVISVVAGVLVISLPNAVYSALSLILVMLCIAVFYLLLNAQFIAAVQVIIYAGAIMVLFLFVIMLLGVGREQGGPLKIVRQKLLGVLLAVVLLISIFSLVGAVSLTGETGPFTPERVNSLGNTQVLARVLFTDYIFPFEIASILLFIAIIGAVVLAKRKL